MTNQQPKKRDFSKLRGFMGRNLALKIISLFFAVILWSYVLNVENPTREKILRNIPVTFVGEDKLNNQQKLMVRGAKEDILKDVNVVVTVPARMYGDVTAENVIAVADLSGIATSGEHTIRIEASVPSIPDVTVLSVSPYDLDVEVDVIRERVIPVEVQYTGTLPEGYWRSDVELIPSTITLTGAASDLEKVATAVCEIDLTDRTTSMYDSKRVILMDNEGVTVDHNNFTGDMAYISYKMTILPKKTVPLDIDGALLGTDDLAAGYEMLGVSVTPSATVEIAAPQSVLDTIDSISIDPINLQGASESVLNYAVNLQLPKEVQVIGNQIFNVFVRVEEKTRTDTYYDIPIEVRNLGKNLEASLNIEAGKIMLTGPLSLLDSHNEKNLSLFVDASGLSAGDHELMLYAQVEEGEDGLTTQYWPSKVTLTLTNP